MQEQFSEKDADFIERNGRLVFLAFLKPIINGHGWDFKEVQISKEKRLDCDVTYYQHKYVIELKIWHGQKTHENGINQLAEYLDLQKMEEGYLVIFDKNLKKKWRQEDLKMNEKRAFAVWV
jgi:hypothetical protein